MRCTDSTSRGSWCWCPWPPRIYLVDRAGDSAWPWLLAAVVAAVVGSLSSLQGLLIWPSVLVLLWLRRRPGVVLAAWVGAAAATGVADSFDFDFPRRRGRGRAAAGSPPMLRFGVAELGNVIRRGGRPMEAIWRWAPPSIAGHRVRRTRPGWRGGARTAVPRGWTLVGSVAAFAASAAVGRSHLGLGRQPSWRCAVRPHAVDRDLPFPVARRWLVRGWLTTCSVGRRRPVDGTGPVTPAGRWAAACPG